jgi:3-polyprenyl-4-hydroxybenzoate decarboxylase
MRLSLSVTLRGWLDRLARNDRLAIMRPEADLRFEIAAIAKRRARRPLQKW